MIQYGYGLDVSESRIDFAQLWADDLLLGNNVDFIQADILDSHSFDHHRLSKIDQADIIICITATFGYFAPLEKNGDSKVLSYLAECSPKGAVIFFEFYQYVEEIKSCSAAHDKTIQIWNELPDKDPFRFTLHKTHWDKETSVLTHEKIFINRDGKIDEPRGDMQRIYKVDELEELLKKSGMTIVNCYGDWDGKSYSEGNDEILIVEAIIEPQKPLI